MFYAIRYSYKKRPDDKWEVKSHVHNVNFLGGWTWFDNYIAECDTEEEAKTLAERLEKLDKRWG